MPHAVLEGPVDLDSIFGSLQKKIHRGSDLIVRIEEYFANRSGDSVLARAVAVEGNSQSFFILVSSKGNKTTIRLDPCTDPEKTDGVKLALAMMAKQIMEINPDLVVTKTNISQHLEKCSNPRQTL
jgi:hypothetical protein